MYSKHENCVLSEIRTQEHNIPHHAADRAAEQWCTNISFVRPTFPVLFKYALNASIKSCAGTSLTDFPLYVVITSAIVRAWLMFYLQRDIGCFSYCMYSRCINIQYELSIVCGITLIAYCSRSKHCGRGRRRRDLSLLPSS